MFQELGYFKEFYKEGKLIGIVNCEKDREEVGYNGRQKEIIKKDIMLTNKKKVKANVEYLTILYPLCGRINK
jgi:hypothetical protein